MKNNQIKFSKRIIQAIPVPPTGKRVTYHDTQQQGLTIRITHTGAKTFIVRARIAGVPEYVTLGTFPTLSIQNARKAAQEVFAKIARGQNPAEEYQHQKSELTLSEAWELYFRQHVEVHLAAGTIAHYTDQYRLHMSAFKHRRLGSIKRKEIRALHLRMGEKNGKHIANRVLGLFRSMYKWLANEEYFDGRNPAQGIKQFKEESRDRFIQPNEMKAFCDSMNVEPNDTLRDYIWIALFTGGRKQNVLSMRWSEIDFEQGVWTHRSKGDHIVSIPLEDNALTILKQRCTFIDCEWVFPSSGSKGHLASPNKGLNRIIKRAGLQHLRIHDLRRTFGSYQAMRNSSIKIISQSLGQLTTHATPIYTRLSNTPVRESVSGAVSDMMAYGQRKKAEVVQLKQ